MQLIKKSSVICCVLLLAWLGCALAQSQSGTFTNPLLPAGADPWVTYKDGYYYYMNTAGNRLAIRKTKDLGQLALAERKVVWTPPEGTPYSREIWAPELHYLEKKWYIYFSADDGKNKNHRIFVLENPSADPLQGNWQLKGKVGDNTNKWAIDGSVFYHNKQLYMIWAGWEGNVNGQQNIYIAKMRNPYTISGKRVKISSPQYQWEKHGDLHDPENPPHVNVNEGPEVLSHGNKLFLIYSASGCWTDNYSLGMMSAGVSSNLLNPKSWKKYPKPVFETSATNSVYAPGHNSFFKSPDGREDWILYHANPQAGCGCGGQRSPRMQKFSWNKDGTPNFGFPVKSGEVLATPSSDR